MREAGRGVELSVANILWNIKLVNYNALFLALFSMARPSKVINMLWNVVIL